MEKETTTKLKPEYVSPKLAIYGSMVTLTASGSTGKREGGNGNGNGKGLSKRMA